MELGSCMRGYNGDVMAYDWGVADHIQTQAHSVSGKWLSVAEKDSWKPASSLLWWSLLCVGVLVLLARLFVLQVVRGPDLRLLADEQRIRLVSLPAPRGIVYDRNGNALVRNIPVFRKVIMDKKRGLVLQTISRDEALQLSANHDVSVVEAVDREYLFKAQTAHILGYIGEASKEELQLDTAGQKSHCDKNLVIGSLVGRSGIEQTYDCWLRGQDGSFLVEVDTGGGLVREMGREEPVSGRRLNLTIDIALQQVVADALGSLPGAVVASDPRTGEILAMASSPTFDPSYFGITARESDQVLRTQMISDYLTNASKPMLNRAITAAYPPGSLFKLVTAAGGLQGNVITKDFTYEDKGLIQVGEYQYRNWYMTQHGATEGSINLSRALSRSTDTFFYYLGEKMGAEALSLWGEKFGLGRKTGLDLIGEAAGLMPNPKWKLETIGERWYLGNTYHLSIGQGDLLVTPLQANLLTGVFANGGRLCQPRLVKDEDAAGKIAPGSQVCESLELSDTTIQTVLQGMIGACSPGGTAVPFFEFKPLVGCKTGTAEFGPRDAEGHRPTHAWFTILGPLTSSGEVGMTDAEKPIVLTVLVENGGEGSKAAAPVAKKIFDYWFDAKPAEKKVSEQKPI